MSGFVDGLLKGYGAVEGMVGNAQRRQAFGMQIASAQRANSDEQARRDALSGAFAPTGGTNTDPSSAGYENSMDLGGAAPTPAKRPPMHEALSAAAYKMAERGDLEGAERFTKQAAAYKTLWAEGKISDAWRAGPQALVDLANEYAPGQNFKLSQGQDGTLALQSAGVGGQPVVQQFRNQAELGAWAQQIANPGNLFSSFHEQEKLKLERLKTQAQTDQANAAASASRAQAGNYSAQATQTAALTPAKVALTEAQTGAAQANTVQSYAGANASNASAERSRAEGKTAGMGTIQKNYNDLLAIGFPQEEAQALASGAASKGKAREQAILDVVGKLTAADAAALGRAPRSQEELLRDATALVDGAAQAAGTSRVGQGVGMRRPAAAPAASTPPGMSSENQRRAAQIRAAVKSGQMTREAGINELKGLGFQ